MPIIDERKKKLIREARRHGMTYHMIETQFGVSRQTTVNYLKGIPRGDRMRIPALEAIAERFLNENGFKNLVEVNTVADYPATDFIANRGKHKWSINIRSRSLSMSGDDIFIGTVRILSGYRNAVAILDEKNVEKPVFLELVTVTLSGSSDKGKTYLHIDG